MEQNAIVGKKKLCREITKWANTEITIVLDTDFCVRAGDNQWFPI